METVATGFSPGIGKVPAWARQGVNAKASSERANRFFMRAPTACNPEAGGTTNPGNVAQPPSAVEALGGPRAALFSKVPTPIKRPPRSAAGRSRDPDLPSNPRDPRTRHGSEASALRAPSASPFYKSYNRT